MINNTQLQSKLNNYAAFATAFLFTHNLNAEIVYTDIEPDITLNNEDYYYEIDIDNGGVNDFQLLRINGVYYSYWESVYRSFTALFFDNLGENKFFAGSYFTVGSAMYSSYQTFRPYAIPVDYSVGPLLSFQSEGWPLMVSHVFDESHNLIKNVGHWSAVGEAYIGIRMGVLGEAHYGWIRVTIIEEPLSMIIHDFAYETTLNKPIRTGATFNSVAEIESGSSPFSIVNFGNNTIQIITPNQLPYTTQLFDLSGKIVFTSNQQIGNSTITIPPQTSIYILQIQSEGNQYGFKIHL
ncbi:MAG TPA: T9SS type A sorting domain-containing protein [Chitinophagales bacterium]|nr:T9SS type A sorting domain-containing protein [Chitinophagales bacterium]HRG26360.1 T9SS type A sorting domain-containing protein [Chitinophagales bacterium]HRG85361.1 T9SS type A sorting domain-containing protein [Chitinophagales bacterium]HRH52462.1 T9SS type A sorting domain-containing protein [Chitinophagales bacterium]